MSAGDQLCDGCGNPASSFQCPLCQAEIVTDRGFFCGQECFAKNWLKHRNAFHKKGVVRAKQQLQPTSVEASGDGRKRSTGERKDANESIKKRRKLATTVEVDTKEAVVVPWIPLSTEVPGAGEVTPLLSPDIPRAVIGGCPSADCRTSFWSAAFAASRYIAAVLSPRNGDTPPHVLVVTSGPLEAHAMAWAARCAGLAGVMRLFVSAPVEAEGVGSAKKNSGERRVVITTQAIVRHVADGSVAVWLPSADSLLVTLPGVVNACDLQAVHTRAVFFVYRSADSALTEDNWCAEEEIVHHVSPLPNPPAALHHYFDTVSPKIAAFSPNGDNEADSAPTVKLLRFDNDVSTALLRGDLAGAVQHLVRLYSTNRGVFEEVLVNSLLSALGAANVAHAHHTLAYVARRLVDQSERFDGPPGGTLKEMALRAVAKVVRLFPPIREIEEGKAVTETNWDLVGTEVAGGSDLRKLVSQPSTIERKKFANYYATLPNLQLQATMCYLYDHAPPGIIDAFGAAWGVSRVVPGFEALKMADRKREDAVRRLRSRYGSKLTPTFANYLVVLMHFIYDAVAGYSLSVEEVERRTLWSMTLEPQVGLLPSFLSNCFLLRKEDTSSAESKRGTTARLSSRRLPHKTPSRMELLRSLPVRTALPEEPLLLSWLTLPLAGQRQREVQRLHRQAVEEILMAMPRKPRPMYVGDVGNLIGKWPHFNCRFDGSLGVSLMEFLMQHPEAFRVVGNLVTRRTAGVSEPVRMRFDNDDSGDDSDNDNDSDKERKVKDRALLTGAKGSGGRGLRASDLPARARKKAAVKAFNKARFNRNYKPLDSAAKVPGYVKHGPRKVKGRGRKANKRATKRGG
ncbi:hypothetical protein TraAM80_04804 [Trypanosoma rangeli]|uniref:C6H2-type domain-containing protein n=1 Tax=Trypanosoma rangeli TaxID=5698 RepID=A0A422NHM2_TRYRA|nr:uncharacterized protein TraAM80_04804 [Trypanosoma rangeli]RNF04951.1 hypothetical protein TraAM80_04804 [Trypanosoma rangeli]|eukprot:RNF04951.1 hypothetical protein TraAM80_04804 [Trypanosoma rangeli]